MSTRERHPSEDAEVIVFLDANMPSVRECGPGCSSNADRMCLHRFGPRIWVCERPKNLVRPGEADSSRRVPFGRLRDLEVVDWCVAAIRRRWADRRGIVQKKHFVIATHDRSFLEDARTQYGRGRRNGFPLRFSSGWTETAHGQSSWILSGQGKRGIRLEILALFDGYRDRNHDLWLLLCSMRELRRISPAPVA